jgi:hypothetical protein
MSPSNEEASEFDGEAPVIPAMHRQGPTAGVQTIGCVLAGFFVLLPALAYFGLLAVLIFDTLFFDDRLFFSLPDDVHAFLIWIYAPVAHFIGPYLQG